MCGHGALKKELATAWPTISFHFGDGGYDRMLEDYKDNRCEVLAVGKTDVEFDTELTKSFCDAGLVLTDSLIVEIVSLLDFSYVKHCCLLHLLTVSVILLFPTARGFPNKAWSL